MTHAARLSWGAFLLTGLAAAMLPAPLQLAYASAAILVLGLPHGASDLAIVPPGRIGLFLLTYGVTIGAVLAWWLLAPFGALLAFLALSAVHFGGDDAPATRRVEQLCRGLLMVAGPALLHRPDLSTLFAAITGEPARGTGLVSAMAWLAGVAVCLLPPVLVAMWTRGDRRGAALLAGGAMALIALPPLVGFTIAFVVLHARVQLAGRMAALGYDHLPAYLRQSAPTLAGAALVIAGVAILFAGGDAPATTTLFAGIAALAVPHMLVTPLWVSRSPRDHARATPMVAKRHSPAS